MTLVNTDMCNLMTLNFKAVVVCVYRGRKTVDEKEVHLQISINILYKSPNCYEISSFICRVLPIINTPVKKPGLIRKN